MGHRKGGRPDRAADSRSAVSPLRPTEGRARRTADGNTPPRWRKAGFI